MSSPHPRCNLREGVAVSGRLNVVLGEKGLAERVVNLP